MRNRRLFTVAGCAGALVTTVLVAPAASAETQHHASGDRGGQTTVVLNPDLVPVLTQTQKVRAIKPGRLTAPGGVAQLSFPITEIEGKVIEHAGGLAFTPVGGGTLRITRFNVDLKTGFLNAKTVLNGTPLPAGSTSSRSGCQEDQRRHPEVCRDGSRADPDAGRGQGPGCPELRGRLRRRRVRRARRARG